MELKPLSHSNAKLVANAVSVRIKITKKKNAKMSESG